MNNTWLKVPVFVLGCCVLAACQKPTVTKQTDAQGLAKVDNTGMAAAKADPSVNFSQFHDVVIADIDFSHLQIVQPTDSSPRYGPFTLGEKDKAQMREAYREQAGSELSKNGGWQVVDANAAKRPGTLVIFTEMLRLQPNAPREQSERFTQSARDKTFTKGAGSMTLESSVVDAGTGKTVAVFGDTLLDTEVWSQNDPVANRAAVERAFSSWGLKMRNTLQALSGPH